MLKMIFFVCRDRMPLWRVDISVFFGKYLRRFGWRFAWFAVGDSERPDWMSDDECHSVPPPRGAIGMFFFDRRRDFIAAYSIVRYQPTLVIVRDDYIALLLVGLACSFRRIPCVYWMSFMMEDGFVEIGRQRRDFVGWLRVRYGYFYGALGRFSLRFAKHLIVQSEVMQRRVNDRRLYSGDSTVIHMAVDFEAIAEIVPMHLNLHFFNLGYSGSISCLRGFETIFRAIAIAKENSVLIKFHMVGWYGTKLDEEILEGMIESLSIRNEIIFYGKKSWAKACEIMSGCDVCLSPVPNSLLYEVGSPTKIFEYMALGKPIIANHHPAHDALFNECNFGWLCDLNDVQLSAAISNAASSNSEIYDDIGVRVYKFASDFHSYAQRGKVLDALLNRLLK